LVNGGGFQAAIVIPQSVVIASPVIARRTGGTSAHG
jgi:hypothetical protein